MNSNYHALMHYTRPCALGFPLLLAVASGCSGSHKSPELARLYNRTAQQGHVDRNPVILIPGILGSKLEQSSTGVMVWGAFGGGSANPETPEGARLTFPV